MGGCFDVACTRRIGAGGIASGVETIGKEAPAVGRNGIELHGAAQRRLGLGTLAMLEAGDAQLEMPRCRMRKFRGQRFQHLQRRLQPPCAPVRGAQDETRGGVTGVDCEDFTGLLRGKVSVCLEQSPRMRNREVNRPKALRGHVQSCTRCISHLVYELIRNALGRFVNDLLLR